MENINKVLEVMKTSGEAMRPGDIADKAGIDKKDLDKVIKKLKNQDMIFSPKKCFWQAR